jgi:hypothetical protein
VKKAFSILLLATFLFNLGGYYFFFWAMKAQASKELSTQIENEDYDESETFEIKIPIALPYPVQSSEFEKQSGDFVYQGKHYQLVKQKYENDVLTVVCLKDKKINRLAKAMDSFSEASGDQPAKNSPTSVSVKVLQDYISTFATALGTVGGWSQSILHTPYFNNFIQVSLFSLSPPPWA